MNQLMALFERWMAWFERPFLPWLERRIAEKKRAELRQGKHSSHCASASTYDGKAANGTRICDHPSHAR